jgi:hypothetical protein
VHLAAMDAPIPGQPAWEISWEISVQIKLIFVCTSQWEFWYLVSALPPLAISEVNLV